jgi:hypothetical protein
MRKLVLVLLVCPSLMAAQVSPEATRATPYSGPPITRQAGTDGIARMSPTILDDMPGPAVQLRDAMPGSVALTWSPLAGASGYLVYRNDLGQVTPTPLPSGSTSFLHLAGTNDFRVTYQYRVVALYPNGHNGPGGWVPFQPPKPMNPTGFAAEIRGTTAVLKWIPVPGVHHYLLAGPGTGPNGDSIPANETQRTLTNVAPGEQTWTLGSYYPPGNISTNWQEWSKATSRPASGKYRITIAGFRVNHQTYDDQLNRDGWSDEVFATAFVQQVDRNNSVLLDTGTVQSRTHGDSRGYPDRLPAGQAGAGLTAGDVVPKGWDERTGRSPVQGSFPLLVWEGELMDGKDALVIRPSLWEVDGDNTAFQYWKGWVARTDPRALVANAAAQSITQVTGDTIISTTSQALTTRWGRGAEAWADAGRDRPIGMTQYRWHDLVLVLTREAIEAELAKTSGTRGTPGLLALQLVDTARPDPVGASMSGDYTLYLRVEPVR